MKHTILIAEHHRLIRLGLCTTVERRGEGRVVAVVDHGTAAVQETLAHRPDLLLLDFALPGCDCVDVVRQIRRHAPRQRILALGDSRARIQVNLALRVGCNGYLLKDADDEEVHLAIQLVLAGGRFISNDIADDVLSGMLGPQDNPTHSLWDRLSMREQSVFRHIAKGGTNRSAADVMRLSHKTVEKHRANVMRKLSLRNAAELMMLAVELGVIERPHALHRFDGTQPQHAAP